MLSELVDAFGWLVWTSVKLFVIVPVFVVVVILAVQWTLYVVANYMGVV